MSTLDESFTAILAALVPPLGPGRTAPAPTLERDGFAALVTALLARSVAQDKAERGCRALAEAGLLDPGVLAEADRAEIQDALRTGGLKLPPRALGPILRLARWFATRVAGQGGAGADTDILSSAATEELRSELAALSGIGPATADSLLLRALARPVYPVDRATYRILVRHGWLDITADYDEARDRLERLAPNDPGALAQLSDGLVRIGREFCRVAAPRCEHCPLRPFLPEGGPIDPGIAYDPDDG